MWCRPPRIGLLRSCHLFGLICVQGHLYQETYEFCRHCNTQRCIHSEYHVNVFHLELSYGQDILGEAYQWLFRRQDFARVNVWRWGCPLEQFNILCSLYACCGCARRHQICSRYFNIAVQSSLPSLSSRRPKSEHKKLKCSNSKNWKIRAATVMER